MTAQAQKRVNIAPDTTLPTKKKDYDTDVLMAQLPEGAKEFVLYEAPVSLYLPSFVSLINRIGLAEALKYARRRVNEDSLKVYGHGYPIKTKKISAEDLGL